MIKPENKVIEFGGDGLKFEIDSGNRPCIQEVDKGEFVIYTNGGTKHIHRDEIDDLIILLQEVKLNGYKLNF